MMRFAFAIASPYTSGFITGVNVGSLPENHVKATSVLLSALAYRDSRP
jgi:hypothetical protein